jgi:UDP:flavonoid glycosyltransferase YjiC (YdhE family)/glycosyltransferase involved in cell wall biosynthesis
MIHIVNPFENALGGSELAALALHAGLRERVEVRLWTPTTADPRLVAQLPITRIDTFTGASPQGGTLIIAGSYFVIGEWLERARPARCILYYNTVVGPGLKMHALDRLRAAGIDPEIVYCSRSVARWVGVPGTIFPSRIDVKKFRPYDGPVRSTFTVGRLSRDVPEKHHPEDPDLYRTLAARGVFVTVMGGTCLAPFAASASEGIRLLPAGAQDAERYLHTLDCFLYRTSTDWYEAAGRVVCEAMACGLPVVCGRAGGYSEWIEHGIDGFLFDSNEEAEAIVLSLRNDASLRQRIGRAARARTEKLFSAEANARYFDFFSSRPRSRAARREIVFAWELGGNTGHVSTLHPIALEMKARGHDVRFLQRELAAGADLQGAAEIPRAGAPIWVGPATYQNPLNFGEILHNFGYHDPRALGELVDAWRERLSGASAVIANVAPAAHLAARVLGIPSFEISQGFHIPPASMPAPPLRDWERAPRERLEAADRRIVAAINSVLRRHGAAPLATIGDIFTGRSMLLTYPELDIYPERGTADYYGIPDSGEGAAVPEWPGNGRPRVLAYLYGYYPQLGNLADRLAATGAATLVFARGVSPEIRAKHEGGPLYFSSEPMAVSRLLPQCDVVLCHASHQMTAQALLAGKPLLLVPTQLEQFIIMRRVVRQGAGLGIAPDTPDPDIGAALRELVGNPKYAAQARAFAARYAGHDRGAALQTMIARCESAFAGKRSPAPADQSKELTTIEHALAVAPEDEQLWNEALRILCSGRIADEDIGAAHALGRERPLKVAVVTAYYNEDPATLERCHRSVMAQTYPCHHVMVADGRPNDVIDRWQTTHLRLARPAGDFGDTPRSHGGRHAAEFGFDAIAYLDADNSFRPRHIEALVTSHIRSGAPLGRSGRTLHLPDGRLTAQLMPHDFGEHVDTSCLFITRDAFELLDAWLRYPRPLAPIGDRMVAQMARAKGFAFAHTGALTVRYTVNSPLFSRAHGVEPGGTRAFKGAGLRDWFRSLDDAALSALDKAVAFEASRFVPRCLAELGYPLD